MKSSFSSVWDNTRYWVLKCWWQHSLLSSQVLGTTLVTEFLSVWDNTRDRVQIFLMELDHFALLGSTSHWLVSAIKPNTILITIFILLRKKKITRKTHSRQSPKWVTILLYGNHFEVKKKWNNERIWIYLISGILKTCEIGF